MRSLTIAALLLLIVAVTTATITARPVRLAAESHQVCADMLPPLFWPGGMPDGSDQAWTLEPGHAPLVRLVLLQQHPGESEVRVCVVANQAVTLNLECLGVPPDRTIHAVAEGAATNVAGVIWRRLPPNVYASAQLCVAYVAAQ